MFFHCDFVEKAFNRLREAQPSGKRGMERTSCLMYFLAFDRLSNELKQNQVLCDPDTATGRDNRNAFTLHYCRLVLVGSSPGGTEHWVDNLGHINDSGRRTSAGKFSGDFLTVPLKKASQAASPQGHPHRPGPLLTLGVQMYGKKWGVERHGEWTKNIVRFLDDRLSPSPWTDLAVFLLRNDAVTAEKHLEENLICLLKSCHSAGLVDFWAGRIVSERRRFQEPEQPYEERRTPLFNQPYGRDDRKEDAVNGWVAELISLRKENAALRKALRMQTRKST